MLMFKITEEEEMQYKDQLEKSGWVFVYLPVLPLRSGSPQSNQNEIQS